MRDTFPVHIILSYLTSIIILGESINLQNYPLYNILRPLITSSLLVGNSLLSTQFLNTRRKKTKSC